MADSTIDDLARASASAIDALLDYAESPAASTPSVSLRPQPDSNSPYVYDIFISHASEDKPGIVRELVKSLRDRDIIVWYDETELTVGESLRRSIDKWLANSRFGIVVLSPAFFEKNWPQYELDELDGLVTRENSNGRNVILPIWHNVSQEMVMKCSLTLADKVALNTSTSDIVSIVDRLVEVIKPGAVED